MNFLLKFAIVFLVLALSSVLLVNVFGVEFGTSDYWSKHGVFLLVGLTIFPRLTLLISSIPFGGFFWWLGFIFCPRILVAILATFAYFQTNPILVVVSWLIALGGEAAEKYGMSRGKFRVYTMRGGPVGGEQPRPSNARQFPDDAIEAEFTKKD